MVNFKPAVLSQSSLQDYVDCPRRFQLRYLEDLQYPAAETEPILENEIHQREGALFHRLVQGHLIGIPAESLRSLAATPTLERWLSNYLEADLDLVGSEKHVELSLSAPIADRRLIAKYDFVAIQNARNAGEQAKARIFDWKTYRKRPRDDWLAARLQTRVYRTLLVEAGAYLNHGVRFVPEQIEMIYWFADYPNEPARFRYDSVQYKRDLDALTILVNEVRTASEFPKTEQQTRCAYCPYRSYCERGIQAGDFQGLEDELEKDEFFDVNFEQIGEIAF